MLKNINSFLPPLLHEFYCQQSYGWNTAFVYNDFLAIFAAYRTTQVNLNINSFIKVHVTHAALDKDCVSKHLKWIALLKYVTQMCNIFSEV